MEAHRLRGWRRGLVGARCSLSPASGLAQYQSVGIEVALAEGVTSDAKDVEAFARELETLVHGEGEWFEASADVEIYDLKRAASVERFSVDVGPAKLFAARESEGADEERSSCNLGVTPWEGLV